MILPFFCADQPLRPKLLISVFRGKNHLWLSRIFLLIIFRGLRLATTRVSCRPILVRLDRIFAIPERIWRSSPSPASRRKLANVFDPSTTSSSWLRCMDFNLSKFSNLISSFQTWVPLLLESILFLVASPAVIWDWYFLLPCRRGRLESLATTVTFFCKTC